MRQTLTLTISALLALTLAMPALAESTAVPDEGWNAMLWVGSMRSDAEPDYIGSVEPYGVRFGLRHGKFMGWEMGLARADWEFKDDAMQFWVGGDLAIGEVSWVGYFLPFERVKLNPFVGATYISEDVLYKDWSSGSEVSLEATNEAWFFHAGIGATIMLTKGLFIRPEARYLNGETENARNLNVVSVGIGWFWGK